MATKKIIDYTCDPCKERTGKDVVGELVSVDGVDYNVCSRDRKVLDAYLEFRKKYGQSLQRPTRRVVAAARVNGSATDAERSKCGLCRDLGETKEVAKGSRAWHARNRHGLKASEVRWI